MALEVHASNETVVQVVPPGAFVHGRATVSGSGGTPTGAVNFTFFGNASCADPGVAAGSVTQQYVTEPVDDIKRKRYRSRWPVRAEALIW